MADGFDIQALLQNPLFLAGTGALLAEPQDRFRGFLGGLQQGTNMQAQNQLNQLRQLQLKKAQDQMNFNPQNYMIPGQAVPADGAASPQEAVAAKPRLDMQSLLTGGLQNGYSPEQIAQIAGIMDPEAAAQRALAAKQTVVGPGQSIVNGSGQELFHNTNAPPNSTVQAIQQLTQLRDSFPQGSPQYQQYDSALKKATGETEQAQFDQRQRELNDRAAANLDMRQQQLSQQQLQQLQTKTNQFSNQLQKVGIPQAQQQLDYIDEQLAKLKPDQNIPGFNRVDSLTPTFMLSPEAKGMRQAVQSFANVLLKTRSGAAVTEPEQKRFLEELGTGTLADSNQLRTGLKMMRGLLESEKRNAAAGVSNDVLDAYSGTPGAMDFSGYRRKGGNVSVDNASIDDIDAAIARKMGKK